VDVVCEWHAPLEPGIGGHAIRTQPDLVVKETRRQAPPDFAAPGCPDWNLISMVPVPLLLVRARPWSATVGIAAAMDPRQPVDWSVKLEALIVECARTLAGVVGGSLEIYHVLPAPPHPASDQGALEQAATTMGAGARFIQGEVPDGLMRLAEQHRPDILVMGAVARAPSVHPPADGTVAHLLERVECDLLMVKARAS
jgi:universal stress protein E